LRAEAEPQRVTRPHRPQLRLQRDVVPDGSRGRHVLVALQREERPHREPASSYQVRCGSIACRLPRMPPRVIGVTLPLGATSNRSALSSSSPLLELAHTVTEAGPAKVAPCTSFGVVYVTVLPGAEG